MLATSKYIYEVRDYSGKVLMTFVSKDDAQEYANKQGGTVFSKSDGVIKW